MERFTVVNSATVPLLMVVPPVYEFAPVKVRVPVPDLNNPNRAGHLSHADDLILLLHHCM